MNNRELQMMTRLIVYAVVFVVIIIALAIGCQSKLDVALTEVKRLEELRDKIAEIVREQEANVSSESGKYARYLKSVRDSVQDNNNKMLETMFAISESKAYIKNKEKRLSNLHVFIKHDTEVLQSGRLIY